MRGLGTVDVSRLAKAIADGQVHPNFRQGLTWKPSYLPASMGPQPVPPTDYADDATASQIASLLGGRVSQAVPYGVWQGTDVPLANWIELPDGGKVLAGDVAQVATHGASIYGLSTECAYEQMLAMSIPGGAMSSSCQYDAGTKPAELPIAQGQTPGGQYVIPTEGQIPIVINDAPQIADRTNGYFSPPTPIVTTNTPGASVGGGQVQTQQFATGANLSSIPWWGWALAAGAAFMLVKD